MAATAPSLFYFFNAFRSARSDREYGKKDKRNPKDRNRTDKEFWAKHPAWVAGYEAGFASAETARDPRPSYDLWLAAGNE